ncbi:amino acid ABC transporter permease [Thermotoga sp. Ku-13t]|uniref:branched-chain amino acid ABC transporter permease n=1 Tax=Thermotoga sp. Ku-13t TaxID=1755813 RepID=UPI0013ED19D4|nr:branched-chain amino acid ABC transporter permease [Thermotoga sp. Ku-13t]KAF2958152.1 amino acid ABC transporter permease [Thermotoga sp. Ku-13t]
MKRMPLLIILAILLILPLVVRDVNFQHVMLMTLIFAGLGEAWNIITGFAGQTSFGHAAFFGIGAYTSTVLFYRFGVSPWIGMILGSLFAGIVAFIVSYPCFRLKGHYFAIATLAVAEIIKQLFVSWDYVEGATGISIPVVEDSFWAMQFHRSKIPYVLIAYSLFVFVLFVAVLIERNRMGYYLKAIRESHEAAEALGINTSRYKLAAMVVSSMLTALFGTLYAQYILYIDPFMVFGLDVSMKIVLLTVLGGLGNIYGPIVGAAVLVPLSEYTRTLLGGTGRGIDLMIYGVLIVLVVVFEPRGILGLLRRRRRRLDYGRSAA